MEVISRGKKLSMVFHEYVNIENFCQKFFLQIAMSVNGISWNYRCESNSIAPFHEKNRNRQIVQKLPSLNDAFLLI